jgi:nucleotide-binding universal stress UspA family protein
MKILLAIDGSALSEAAVDQIARQHFLALTEVRIVSVVEPHYYPQPFADQVVDPSIYAELEKIARDRALSAIDKARARLHSHEETRQLKISTAIVDGSPKQLILEEAESFGADLIVVGSHGHGMVERFLRGSVSHAVALHAKCSVEIVRSPTKAA